MYPLSNMAILGNYPKNPDASYANITLSGFDTPETSKNRWQLDTTSRRYLQGGPLIVISGVFFPYK